MGSLEKVLSDHLSFIYGLENAPVLTQRIVRVLEEFQTKHSLDEQKLGPKGLSEQDAVLITYGDMVKQEGQAPLQTLSAFLSEYLSDVISVVHILPFYPFSSDDGFSVIDYRQVNPNLGTWEDVSALGKNFKLMFDAVINHISSQSAEFQEFLKGDPKYTNYFVVADPGADTSRVFRPRSSPLLTSFQTSEGEKLVWTTFSSDQIDFNYHNPEVLVEVIKILLFYVAQGAEFIRLDAVTYLWKDLNSSSINLPETHRIIQFMRTVLDIVDPHVALITETNVPHKDNIAYFGDGLNEAQMVYNFALPMLVLHAFHSGSVEKLSSWASTLDLPSQSATFFNFLAGHDGIGITPVRDILSSPEIDTTIERIRKLGGHVAFKSNGDGTQNPYELNINYLDALGDPEDTECEPAVITKRFLAAQAIMLALRGVPGIYLHSLIGSRNWPEGVEKTGRYRTINREKLPMEELVHDLEQDDSLRQLVYRGYCDLLTTRKAHPAFNPYGGQEILSIHPQVFALLRTSLDEGEHLLCLHNISSQAHEIMIDMSQLPFAKGDTLADFCSGESFPIRGKKIKLQLPPYKILWLGEK